MTLSTKTSRAAALAFAALAIAAALVWAQSTYARIYNPSSSSSISTPVSIANGGTNAASFTASNGIVAYNGTSLVDFTGYLLTSAKLTAPNASTTNLTASTYLEAPVSASAAPTVAGQVAIDSTDVQLKIGDGSNTVVYSPYRYLTGAYATTTSWTGTTTPNKTTAPFAGTLKIIQCTTNTGTLNVQVLINGTPVTPMFNASTTAGTVTFTASNTFNRGDVIEFDYGTPASSPLSNTCTARATESGT